MDASEYSTDEGKRKREEEDIVFRKTKKTPRTPTKDNKPEMEQMIEMLKNVAADVKEIKDEQRKNSQDMAILKKELKELKEQQKEQMEEMEKVKEVNRNAAAEVKELKRELINANERIGKLEGEKRKKNVVVYGLKIDTNDRVMLKEELKKFLTEKVGVNVKINNAIKLQEKICLIELGSIEDKINVMKNKYKLRNNQTDRIYINNDMTKNERDIQGIIRQIAKEERGKGKRVKILYQKLMVNEKLWIWNRERGKLVSGDPKN